jgi:cobalt-zinc-cadmium efflux system outer membrane protein
MSRWVSLECLVLAIAINVGARPAGAQAPTIDTQPPAPGSTISTLGTAPGAGANPLGTSPGADEGILGGRVGTSVPRVPPSITRPGGAATGTESIGGIGPTARLRAAEAPFYGPLTIPGLAEDEGPPDGLSLNAAIERLVRANVDLRSKYLEIPQAQADVLTASLRANPVFYADGQLIPYGQYSREQPGGPAQYDVNISYPLDISRKRKARTVVAVQAKRVLEAQYQDAVRLQIDNLYTAFVDGLAAREAVRYSQASVVGLGRVFAVTHEQRTKGTKTEADLNQIKILRDTAEIGLADAEEALRDAKRVLGPLLNIRSDQALALGLRGTIRDVAPPAPPAEELVRAALGIRPDLVAYRLGIARAEADVRLARANRYQDVYLLYQPYTFQNNQPYGLKSATSFALGVTVSVPVHNRNQGNIERAKLNVSQSQLELAAQEEQVITEVQRAERQYALTRAAAARIERDVLPAARQVHDDALKRYLLGEEDVIVYLNAQRDFNDVVRQYADALIRHRRSMLRLNTAVAQRILP